MFDSSIRLNQTVFKAVEKATQKDATIDKTDWQAIQKAIVKDDAIDAGEMALLEALENKLGFSVQNDKGEGSVIEANQVEFRIGDLGQGAAMLVKGELQNVNPLAVSARQIGIAASRLKPETWVKALAGDPAALKELEDLSNKLERMLDKAIQAVPELEAKQDTSSLKALGELRRALQKLDFKAGNLGEQLESFQKRLGQLDAQCEISYNNAANSAQEAEKISLDGMFGSLRKAFRPNRPGEDKALTEGLAAVTQAVDPATTEANLQQIADEPGVSAPVKRLQRQAGEAATSLKKLGSQIAAHGEGTPAIKRSLEQAEAALNAFAKAELSDPAQLEQAQKALKFALEQAFGKLPAAPRLPGFELLAQIGQRLMPLCDRRVATQPEDLLAGVANELKLATDPQALKELSYELVQPTPEAQAKFAALTKATAARLKDVLSAYQQAYPEGGVGKGAEFCQRLQRFLKQASADLEAIDGKEAGLALDAKLKALQEHMHQGLEALDMSMGSDALSADESYIAEQLNVVGDLVTGLKGFDLDLAGARAQLKADQPLYKELAPQPARIAALEAGLAEAVEAWQRNPDSLSKQSLLDQIGKLGEECGELRKKLLELKDGKHGPDSPQIKSLLLLEQQLAAVKAGTQTQISDEALGQLLDLNAGIENQLLKEYVASLTGMSMRLNEQVKKADADVLATTSHPRAAKLKAREYAKQYPNDILIVIQEGPACHVLRRPMNELALKAYQRQFENKDGNLAGLIWPGGELGIEAPEQVISGLTAADTPHVTRTEIAFWDTHNVTNASSDDNASSRKVMDHVAGLALAEAERRYTQGIAKFDKYLDASQGEEQLIADLLATADQSPGALRPYLSYALGHQSPASKWLLQDLRRESYWGKAKLRKQAPAGFREVLAKIKASPEFKDLLEHMRSRRDDMKEELADVQALRSKGSAEDRRDFASEWLKKSEPLRRHVYTRMEWTLDPKSWPPRSAAGMNDKFDSPAEHLFAAMALEDSETTVGSVIGDLVEGVFDSLTLGIPDLIGAVIEYDDTVVATSAGVQTLGEAAQASAAVSAQIGNVFKNYVFALASAGIGGALDDVANPFLKETLNEVLSNGLEILTDKSTYEGKALENIVSSAAGSVAGKTLNVALGGMHLVVKSGIDYFSDGHPRKLRMEGSQVLLNDKPLELLGFDPKTRTLSLKTPDGKRIELELRKKDVSRLGLQPQAGGSGNGQPPVGANVASAGATPPQQPNSGSQPAPQNNSNQPQLVASPQDVPAESGTRPGLSDATGQALEAAPRPPLVTETGGREYKPFNAPDRDPQRGRMPSPNGTRLGTPPRELLSRGRIKVSDLVQIIPVKANEFRPGRRLANGHLGIQHGMKYTFTHHGVNYEVKFHSPDHGARIRHPNGNSANGWTAQIKINGQLMDINGNLVNDAGNHTHIPLDFD